MKHSTTADLQFSHLSATQGISEQHNELYGKVQGVNSANNNEAKRHEQGQSLVLCAKTGFCGGRL